MRIVPDLAIGAIPSRHQPRRWMFAGMPRVPVSMSMTSGTIAALMASAAILSRTGIRPPRASGPRCACSHCISASSDASSVSTPQSFACRLLGRAALEDSRFGFDNLAARPERHAVAVWE
jgi:hypothetical protein